MTHVQDLKLARYKMPESKQEPYAGFFAVVVSNTSHYVYRLLHASAGLVRNGSLRAWAAVKEERPGHFQALNLHYVTAMV